MEIRAKCKFNLDAIKALTHVSTYKKSNPKNVVAIRTICCLVLLLVIVALLFAFEFDSVPIILIVAVMLISAIDLFIYFIFPKIQHKALAGLKDAENEYVFCDDVLKVITKSNEYNGGAEIEYSLFVKVYETSRYFFIYQTNQQVLIVDKSTVQSGQAKDIRNKLSSVVKGKYIICKY